VIELQAHQWDPVQPWAARTGGGVTVAIRRQLQGGEQGAGNRRRAWMHRHRWSRNGRRLLGSHHSALPRGRIIRETDSHDPGDRFASTWRHSQEPGTHKMAVILAIESHDPGTVTRSVSRDPARLAAPSDQSQHQRGLAKRGKDAEVHKRPASRPRSWRCSARRAATEAVACARNTALLMPYWGAPPFPMPRVVCCHSAPWQPKQLRPRRQITHEGLKQFGLQNRVRSLGSSRICRSVRSLTSMPKPARA
jgi:hypothetical protein